MMDEKNQMESFECAKCRAQVSTLAHGTANRNHCPNCLWSLHVATSAVQDDRSSDCKQPMEPIAISSQRDGEWSIVHRCIECGNTKTNRIAGDDDAVLLLALAVKPLTTIPFPVDSVHLEAKARYSK